MSPRSRSKLSSQPQLQGSVLEDLPCVCVTAGATQLHFKIKACPALPRKARASQLCYVAPGDLSLALVFPRRSWRSPSHPCCIGTPHVLSSWPLGPIDRTGTARSWLRQPFPRGALYPRGPGGRGRGPGAPTASGLQSVDIRRGCSVWLCQLTLLDLKMPGGFPSSLCPIPFRDQKKLCLREGCFRRRN